MEPEEPTKKIPEQRPEELGDVSREVLYELVWAEPMLKVAAGFRVSSSYMARICGLMNVPRPERGYWAKLAAGQTPPKPTLPEIRPGDQAAWNRNGAAQPISRPLPRPPTGRPKRKSVVAAQLPQVHPLVRGAKEHFENGRTSYWSKYLRPAKRNLVDLVVTKSGLEKALSFANELFRDLEAHEYRVVIAPNGEPMSRAAVSEHEVPKNQINNINDQSRLWRPGRVTVVYVGSITIGLTIVEMSEVADARYVDGEYVRVDQLAAPRRSRYSDDWQNSKRDFPSGRLCLQAYCPDRRALWTKQWRETKGQELTSRIPTIIRELFDATPHIAELIAAGERQAEIEQIRWKEQTLKWERERAEEAARKARKESKEELLEIVTSWARAKRIEDFFTDASIRSEGLEQQMRVQMLDRLARARKLTGGVDALERFRQWKAPSERLAANAELDDSDDEDC